MFFDRVDAGKQLAAALNKYQSFSPIVFAISDGGVPVGIEIAKRLHLDFSVIIVQKLTFPGETDYIIGALAEDNSMFLLPTAASMLSLEKVKSIVSEQRKEISRRRKILRNDEPLPDITQKVVILVSDGIALGSVVYAAIYLCQKNNPSKIIVAAPVSSPEVARSLEELSDVHETIILKQPDFFQHVSEVYENWQEIPEHEVLDILLDWKRRYH